MKIVFVEGQHCISVLLSPHQSSNSNECGTAISGGFHHISQVINNINIIFILHKSNFYSAQIKFSLCTNPKFAFCTNTIFNLHKYNFTLQIPNSHSAQIQCSLCSNIISLCTNTIFTLNKSNFHSPQIKCSFGTNTIFTLNK